MTLRAHSVAGLGTRCYPRGMKSRQCEWRFGDREESVEAWLRHPDKLHMIVHFRAPGGPENRWYSIMTVTRAWLRRETEGTQFGAIWPALLVVPDGPRTTIEASITNQLNVGWSLVLYNAEPMSGPTEPADR